MISFVTDIFGTIYKQYKMKGQGSDRYSCFMVFLFNDSRLIEKGDRI